MDLHRKYRLRRVINAWGVATRYGVSRSPDAVARAVAGALGGYFDMAELQEVAGARIAAATGAPWACVTHCTAASITLAVAACMTGCDAERVRRLPDTRGMNRRVVLQAGHHIDYGQSIAQAIRLSGAEVIAAGDHSLCRAEELASAMARPGVAALVAVESHLCNGRTVATAEAVELARAAGVPVILDAAAQDLRLPELVAAGADAVLISVQKYLRGPTAGLVLGRRDLLDAVNLQQIGIGRAMKPSKEAIIGTLAALEHRATCDLAALEAGERKKADRFAARLNGLAPIAAEVVPDPTGNPIARVRVRVESRDPATGARALAGALSAADPVVATGAHYAAQGFLNLELLGLDDSELDELYQAIRDAVAGDR